MKRTFPIGAVMVALFLCLSSSTFSHQNFTVTGEVSKESGNPFAHVSEQVKGGRMAAQTGADGTFQLEVRLRSRHSIEVTMKVRGAALNDVIVVGYGTQERSSVARSVAIRGR